MKATELRIGNWVKRDSQPDGFVIDAHSILRCVMHEDWYEPILITPEWLERLGFEYELLKNSHNQGGDISRWSKRIFKTNDDTGDYREWMLKYEVQDPFTIGNVIDGSIYKGHKDFFIIPDGGYEYDGGIAMGENCKYVHQLQNLHLALTGEELEIKETAHK